MAEKCFSTPWASGALESGRRWNGREFHATLYEQQGGRSFAILNWCAATAFLQIRFAPAVLLTASACQLQSCALFTMGNLLPGPRSYNADACRARGVLVQ
jgi:hypothetical protein